MNIRKMMGMEAGVESLQFEIKPKSIAFEGQLTQCFAVYLEKGAQVLGGFESGDRHNSKDSFYKFKLPEPSVFRVRNMNHATYTWNFYRVNPQDKAEVFEDSVHFNLKRSIELYNSEVHQKQKEMQLFMKDKSLNRQLILEAWNRTKRYMRNNKPMLKSIFPKHGMHLQFQLNILNVLDLELRSTKRSLKRTKSEANQLRGPYMIPTSHKEKQRESKEINQPEAVKQKVAKNKLFSSSPQIMLSIKTEENSEPMQDYTTVTIVNPSGIQIEPDSEIEDEMGYKGAGVDSSEQPKLDRLFIQNKKFSTLSDIIERSHQGSSTYGKFSSSNGARQYQSKSDEKGEATASEEHKNIVTVESPLLKFKTLPHQNYQAKHAAINKTSELRRAQTTEKQKSQIAEQSEYLMDSSKISSEVGSSTFEPPQRNFVSTGSGDVNAKYIVIAAFLIICWILGRQVFSSCKGRHCKTPKPSKASSLKPPKSTK